MSVAQRLGSVRILRAMELPGVPQVGRAEEIAESVRTQDSDAKVPENNAAKNSIILQNDLEAAVCVTFLEEMKVIYPNKDATFMFANSELHVSLRDAPSISGRCLVSQPELRLRTSESFGSFGGHVARFLRQEQLEVHRELDLQQKRKKRLQKLISKDRREVVYTHLMLGFYPLLGTALLVLMCFVEPQDSSTAMGLSLVLAVLMCCVVSCCLFCYASVRFPWFILCSLCLTVAAVRYTMAGYWWSALVPAVTCFFCVCFNCYHYLGPSRPTDFVEMEPVVSWEEPNAAERHIVFHGSVMFGGPCVASWPGKYESAWDSLVTGGRKGNISAAVVFLPKGSKDFGRHAPIETEEEGLEGSCWCFPLYGEKKVWGCTWWTKWMQNIDMAVHRGGELEVYYFKGMRGKGKVEHFLTAGKEHLRRETIARRKEDFMKSPEFLAIKSDLGHIQKDPRGDSTSQYSREVQRLFLESLSKEDRAFMEASEGLGNSQKAEVAWLDWKGYRYTEVDVSTWIVDDVDE